MIFRSENPRPQLVKNSRLINLNGLWSFEFDDLNIGHQDKWFQKHQFSRQINVPFPYEAKLSGVQDTGKHDHFWYRRSLDISLEKKKIYLLHFHGLDFYGEIYVNGELAFTHEGGATAFKVDISDKLVAGENELVVYCYDPMEDQAIPRGKQYWKSQSESIFYTKTSGIYKNVYLEVLEEKYLDEIYLLSDIDRGIVKSREVYHEAPNSISYEVSLKGESIINETIENKRLLKEIEHELQIWDPSKINEYTLHDQLHCWSPEHPVLYDLKITTKNSKGEVIEEISTYFAMRKIHVKNGIFYLNNRPYYQKLVLIQGYWRDGILSYPGVEDLEKDIISAKKLGFNGGRMHQKVEEPYYYYLCDKLGFIAWLEYPAGQVFGSRLMGYMQKEWHDLVLSHYNFPSILVYVPLNESWGIANCAQIEEQQLFENSMYYLCKSLDKSRLVVGNDGWELTKTDIYSVHNYMHGKPGDRKTYKTFIDSLKDRKSMLASSPAGRVIVIPGYENPTTPIMLTEFGGVCLQKDDTKGWGYSCADDDATFVKELQRIYAAIAKSKCVVGYCYTQLYDVEQEINGLLTYDREFKVPCEKIAAINAMVSIELQKVK
ncbi:MAG: glycoside hydrolase family 2 [Bacilli bacterium]|nr:glycoside hydrolase family 2 [Bacilli bacterium]